MQGTQGTQTLRKTVLSFPDIKNSSGRERPKGRLKGRLGRTPKVLLQICSAGPDLALPVQSVHNMGILDHTLGGAHVLGYHYSQTLAHWLENWEASKDKIVKAYGERSWRRWRVFLAWSVRISRRGGSTVQWITATKSGQEPARIAAQNRLAPGMFQLPQPENAN
eukprot:Skav200726  [mRNA]  locus=scaffold274:3260:6241:+ [translate_table: standard]